MPPKISPAARKGIKKAAAKPEPPSCASTTDPTIKTEPNTPAAFIKDEEEEKSPSASVSVDNTATDSAKATEKPTKEPTKDTHSKHASPLKESATFKNKEAPKAKPKTKKSNNSAAFTAADLQHYLFPGRRESDTDSIPSFDHTTQQAKTEKQVRFFKDNTHDKHFVQIPVEPLRGNENWREWLVAMQLLFVQHGVWEIVISELKPLPASHPLRVWYQRMRDCAVGLIYVNVSETVRKHSCFLASAVENDPDALMNHLWAHYGEPDLEESHI